MEKMPAGERKNNNFVENGSKLIETLKTENLAALDLHFSESEKNFLNNIEIEGNGNFEVFDLGEGKLVQSISEKLLEMGLGFEDTLGLAEIIASRTLGFKEMMSKEACDVMVRISLPHPYNDVPRWHDDGTYFTQEGDEKVYKMTFAVKGAPTLFGEVLDKEKYDALLVESHKNDLINSDNPDTWDAEDLRIRKEVATVVQKFPDTEDEKASVFLVGHEDAVLHSEPPMAVPRIFVAVIAGSKVQIEEMMRARM